jgi:PhoH-like ATPase
MTPEENKKRKTKTFVLDTNVLIHDPRAIYNFPARSIVIPLTVLEELDCLKRSPVEIGKNARTVIRLLDSLKKEGGGDLEKGVKIETGAIVRISLDYKTNYKDSFALSINDNKIIMTAYLLSEEGHNVVFVSKDIASRVKAEAVGLEAEDYENQKFQYDNLYKGIRHVEIEKEKIDHFYKDGHIEGCDDLQPNEYSVMKSAENTSAIGRYNGKTKRLESLISKNHIWGVKPRNVEQKCAVDLLLRDDVPLVSLVGPAGTGKTLLALACGLRKVFDEGIYSRILVSRPIVPLGRDIGYLPGTKEEKLFHWMQPIYDNLQFLCESSGGASADDDETLKWVLDSKKIEMEAVTYIRGRTLPKMFMIIDEAQNLTPHEIKTVISRAGEGTKVILTGDPTQIDNPYLDKDSNALSYTIGKFTKYDMYGHMFLETTERSALAALAAEVM